MNAEAKVRQVYPRAVCVRKEGNYLSGSVRYQILMHSWGRKVLGMDNQERRAWAEAWRQIEREGIPLKCPYCKTRLKPFEGEEWGPVSSWFHPQRNNGCRWDEYEGLTRRQISAAGARKASAPGRKESTARKQTHVR